MSSYVEDLKSTLEFRAAQQKTNDNRRKRMRDRSPSSAHLFDLIDNMPPSSPPTDDQVEQALRLLIRLEMPPNYQAAALALLNKIAKA